MEKLLFVLMAWQVFAVNCQARQRVVGRVGNVARMSAAFTPLALDACPIAWAR